MHIYIYEHQFHGYVNVLMQKKDHPVKEKLICCIKELTARRFMWYDVDECTTQCQKCDSNGDILMYGVDLCLSVPSVTQMGISLCMV